ncbi:co-chaperone GroES [Sedimentisphaera salicampi]|uniref:Co-chaperonin GroES n=1 Tax=Sedimentisphaera salicampi TaxID=1941349 RepID=A0A1W6LQ51_9BACT|nr:co-chaperone GroES [Sedimentisphaera salicampi]ARN57862.1 co-chaperonin GroES [Sedimentisphaera salicampi]OXU14030.1 co-chaperonin GroES [Sedimentisphaera salicampi]
MKLKPLSDNVLLKRVEESAVTAGGIVLPDSAKEKSSRGEVISTGPGKLNDDGTTSEMKVKKGDVVIFESYAPREVKLDGEEYLIVDQSSIIAVIED